MKGGRGALPEYNKPSITNSGPMTGKKIGQFSERGWSTTKMREATSSGVKVPSVNMANGNPATQYVHPDGSRLVIDDVTKQPVQFGEPGFKY